MIAEPLQPTMGELAGTNEYSEMITTQEAKLGGSDSTYELPGEDTKIEAVDAETCNQGLPSLCTFTAADIPPGGVGLSRIGFDLSFTHQNMSRGPLSLCAGRVSEKLNQRRDAQVKENKQITFPIPSRPHLQKRCI